MADENLITITAALDKAEPKLRDAFLEMIALMKGAVSLSDLTILIEQGRLEEAFATMLGASARLGRVFNEQLMSAANNVAHQLNRTLGEIIFDFDATNPFVMRAMRENRMRLISGFSARQREATRLALLDGASRGVNPREMARIFRSSIGLTPYQVRVVNNFRRSLESNDSAVFQRALRDKRFDATIRRAIRDGTPLTREQIDKMVGRYREKWLKYRAEVIARTEALRSVHLGEQMMFDQAIADGTLDPTNMQREWNTAKDERVRSSHSFMHNQTRGMQEEFTSGQGHRTMHPGGFGVASEDIQCRCTVGTRITSLEGVGAVEAELLT